MTRSIGRKGQLVLIGAIVIAAVIIGLTVLVNTVLFTETVGSDSVNSRIDSTAMTDYEVRKGVRSTVLRVNHADRNISEGELHDRVGQNVTAYSRLLAEVQAISKPMGLEVGYHESGSEFGTRIVQGIDDEMSDPTDTKTTWRPYLTSSAKRVGWFTMNIQMRNTTRDPFHVVAENDTATLDLTFLKTSNSTLRINSNWSSSSTTTVCDPSSGRVLLDVYAGAAFSDDCSFSGTNLLSGPEGTDTYDLQFVDGDEQVGKFSLVINESSNLAPGTNQCMGVAPASADPCEAPAIWAANVTMDVTGEGLEYANQYDITIYSNNR